MVSDRHSVSFCRLVKSLTRSLAMSSGVNASVWFLLACILVAISLAAGIAIGHTEVDRVYEDATRCGVAEWMANPTTGELKIYWKVNTPIGAHVVCARQP